MMEKKIEGKTAREWFDLAFEEGDREKEIEYYSKVLEIDPKDADTWNNKGNALDDLGRHEEAIRCYDRALEIDPNYAGTWYNKGIALHHLERYKEAIRCYDRVLEVDPDETRGWDGKGTVLDDFGRHEEAIRCYDKALEIDPNDADAWYNKGSALGDLERYEEAIRCYDKALEIDPTYTSAWYNKGYALGKLGIYKEAIRCYDKALKIDSTYANAWHNKGYALGNLKSYKEAIWCFNRVLEIDPKDTHAWSGKGYALGNLKRYEEAIECFSKVLKIDPNYEKVKSIKKLMEDTLREKAKKTALITPLITERTIYDPCKRDFIEGQLPRMKEWIKRYDPSAYWFAVSIQNNTDKTIEEWGVELETSSALKIKEAKIEGIEIEIPHEAHLGLFKISVPKEYGIVIPKGGTQRVYFKLRAEKPKTTYKISGVFKSEITGDVPIRAKEFKYLCDAGVSPEAVKTELKKTFSEKDAARLALSFKTVQELDRMCDREAKTDEYMDKLLVLKNYTEGFSDTFTNQVDELSKFMKEEQLEYLDDKYKRKVRRFCTNLVDVWISEFLKG